ncbi:alpha/beta-hydrolase [Trametes versicolor FP-101664 SS1]|uniref:alpha/beta-hydrolase n=1 Tax=Trametes versicolor (strain FP-101664) TaxID=717944 RepID=UPI00046245AB|nr:alpha/beta-hydrolase [Trametes versicolor FP-101664 SS1]EIW64718.1 alpha/beta-hydrolase [Trametes versicolor FP-101664 SS1]
MANIVNFPVSVDHSMEALPATSRIRQIYPEDLFPNGNYAQLPYGRVRYWLLGPEDGTKVVLIHGISTPGVTWKEIAPYLAEHGFRVLVYDLYGKGYSEAPKTAFDATLFVVQLALLLQYIRWDAAHIVGFSMGGGVAASFAASVPHLVAGKVVFIAAAGLLTRLSAPNPSARVPIPEHLELRDLQSSALPGYKRSLQSCVDVGPIRGLEAAYDAVSKVAAGPAQEPLQVLVIHGTDDAIVPYEEANKIKGRVPQAEIVPIEGATHSLVLQEGHWQIVAENLARFLK